MNGDKILDFLKQKRLFLGELSFALFFCLLDLLTKALVFVKIDEIYIKTATIHSHIKINGLLNLVRVLNTGISFGLFRNMFYGQYFFSVLTLCIVAFLILLLWKCEDFLESSAYSLIISGAFGNLYDRILFGGVRDFIDFHWGEHHWPAFNIADSCICIGVGLLILKDIIVWWQERKAKEH
jgi:signal peptidase II